MTIPRDFREFFELLNAQEAEYVVVGGYAVAHHGAPRFTGDMDILVRPSAENGARVVAALKDFGMGDLPLRAEEFARADTVFQIGVPPLRIDLLTAIDGVDFESAMNTAERVVWDDVEVPIIGRRELVRNKRASGRAKDVADLEALGE